MLCCVVDLEPCLLSCPGSSVGRALCLVSGVSWVRVPPRAAKRSCPGWCCCVNPRRACAARVNVVVLCVCVCVCVCVCPGLASATHATTRPSRHTYGLSIVLAPEQIWRFSLVSKIAIALHTHERTPFLYAKRAHFSARDFTRAVNLYTHV